MNLPLQPPTPEEKEQPVVLHSSEDTPTSPSLTSDSPAEETAHPDAFSSDEDAPTLPSLTSDAPAEETAHPDAFSSDEDAPTLPSLASDAPAEETAQQVSPSELDNNEAPELDNNEAPELDNGEDFEADEDEDFEADESIESLPQPTQSGVFIHKGILIAAACAVVVAALLVVFLVFFNHPKDPPTDWIASTTTSGKTLYYLHWTNQNGDLKGQLKLAAKVDNAPQSLTAVTTGLYNRDNHIIYVVVIVNGQPNTLTGKINDANDTLTLNLVDGSGQTNNPLVFHTGSATDYNQAVKKL